MTVVADVQSRISSIQQLFPAVSPPGPAGSSGTSGTAGTATASFGSELESALAASTTDPVGDPAANRTAANATASYGQAAGGRDIGAAVVADAQKYLGVPYVLGGTDPAKGLDCSALVQRAYADLGVALPRTSQQQALQGTPVASLADARPGDLVCFGNPATHIGIYVGDGKMIVAPHTGTDVQIQPIGKTPSTIRRIVAAPLAVGGVGGTGVAPVSTTTSGRPGALGGIGNRAAETAAAHDASQYASAFSAAEQKYGLPTGLLSAVAHTESGFDPAAVSSAGAVGLMQLMPATASALGVDPANPTQAIDGAARLLRGELDKFGSVPLALAAYNAGGPAVDKYGDIPPYPQTQNYVQKVMSYLSEVA
jgi:cell wall-associated NlpC family hydrolase